MKKLYRRIISLMIALTLTAANIPENLLLSAAYGEDAFIFSAGDMVIDDAVLSDGDTVMDDTMILDGDLAFDDTVFTDEDVYPDDTVIPGETLNFDDTESLDLIIDESVPDPEDPENYEDPEYADIPEEVPEEITEAYDVPDMSDALYSDDIDLLGADPDSEDTDLSDPDFVSDDTDLSDTEIQSDDSSLLAAADPVKYLDAGGAEQSCAACTEVASITSEVTLSSGWYVVSGTVTASGAVIVSGDVYLILRDGAKLQMPGKRIEVNSGSSLTIYAQSTGDSMGELIADLSGTSSMNAAIGGKNGQEGGSITINGGRVTAKGRFGAGIGGGSSANGGTVCINGGRVAASSATGSGIGAGEGKSGGTIILGWNALTDSIYANKYGGTVTFARNFLIADGQGPDGGTVYTQASAENIAGKTLIPYDGRAVAVTLYSNDGSGRTLEQTIVEGSSLTLENSIFTREGFSLTGWTAEPDGSGTSWDPGAQIAENDIPEGISSLSLYAQWEADDITITYHAPAVVEGQTEQVYTQTVKAGAQTALTALSEMGFALNDYTGDGWNTQANQEGVHYDDQALVTLTKALDLYLSGHPNHVTIIFRKAVFNTDDKWETVESYTQTVEYDKEVMLSKNTFVLTEEDIFTGWNTRPDGNGTAYQDEEEVTLREDLILYAQWKRRIRVSIQSGIRNGTVTVSDSLAESGDTVRISAHPDDGYMLSRLVAVAAYLYPSDKPGTYPENGKPKNYTGDGKHTDYFKPGVHWVESKDSEDLIANNILDQYGYYLYTVPEFPAGAADISINIEADFTEASQNASRVNVVQPEHGRISVSTVYAAQNEQVAVRVVPDEGWHMDDSGLIVTEGNTVLPVMKTDDGSFVFKMDDSAVQVKALLYADKITYLDEEGKTKTLTTGEAASEQIRVLSETDRELTSGWYIVAGAVVIPEKLQIRAGENVRLLLLDGSILQAKQGIRVENRAKSEAGNKESSGRLEIYAQSTDKAIMGHLEARGYDSAGIGGGREEACGTVVINGGWVTARGGSGYPGIGGEISGGWTESDFYAKVLLLNGGITEIIGEPEKFTLAPLGFQVAMPSYRITSGDTESSAVLRMYDERPNIVEIQRIRYVKIEPCSDHQTEWMHTDTEHWQACIWCGAGETRREAHTLSGGICTACGRGASDAWQELQAQLNAGGTIKLTHDIKAGSADTCLLVPRGVEVTLDLNGHTVDRGLTHADADGCVIMDQGNLTVKDSSPEKTGKITGGNNHTGGGGIIVTGDSAVLNLDGGSIEGNRGIRGAGINISDSGNVIMTGGRITGNRVQAVNADSVDEIFAAGGVLVGENCHFTLKGGTISGNNGYCGGVSSSALSNFVMEGGSITGNGGLIGGVYGEGTGITIKGGSITGNRGTLEIMGIQVGGVFGSIAVEGAPVITGNTDIYGNPSDVILGTVLGEGSVQVTGPLTADAKIGIGWCSFERPIKRFLFTDGLSEYSGSDGIGAFFCNDADRAIVLAEDPADSTKMEAALVPVDFRVTFVSEGKTWKTVGCMQGAAVAEPDPAPAKAGDTFLGWYQDAGLTKAYDFSTAVTSDLTLYAKWKIASHTHAYGGWRRTKEPTVFTAGTEMRTCSVCGAKVSRVIPKLKAFVTLSAGTIKVDKTKVPLKKKQKLSKITAALQKGDSIVSVTPKNKKIVTASFRGTKITLKAGTKTGATTVTVKTRAGVSTSFTVKVQTGTVTAKSIAGFPKKLTLQKGKTYQLPKAVKPISVTAKPKFTSSAKKIAKVSASGKITAVKKGTATITVTVGKKKFKCRVTVTK